MVPNQKQRTKNKIMNIDIENLTLVQGTGDYNEGTACVMSAAALLYAQQQGHDLTVPTDELDCACPVLRALLIVRNDGPWQSDEERTKWGLNLIPKIIGSRDDSKTQDRTYLVVDAAVRKIAPRALRAAGLEEEAAKLESLDPVVDVNTNANAANAATNAATNAADAADAAHAAANAARAATYSAHAAAYSAHAAANAARAATYSAHAATYSAHAATYSAHAAAYSAHAAANAARAAAWDVVDGLIETILV